jgi:hypothetical protein
VTAVAVARTHAKSGARHAGFLPGGGFIGTGLGALDSFLVDKVIAEPGAYSFLGDTWPSLFTT